MQEEVGQKRLAASGAERLHPSVPEAQIDAAQ